jgi:AAA family ATP:ADP antiporter
MKSLRFLRQFWLSLFDIRPGERLTTFLMGLYLMLVLFAYYILKPVSHAMFLNRFDIDDLPWLYVLVSIMGGFLAYLYTKLAVRSSLRRAIDIANSFCVGMLVLFWWLIHFQVSWLIYAFNIWVSILSIVLVSQGWLVAANVFTPRAAKRLYGILGVGSVLGAAFGGQFTAFMVYYVGTRNLLLASAAIVVISYIACRWAILSSGKSLSEARGAEEQEFAFVEIVDAVRRHRHLQVIIAIISITFIVDVMVQFQFSAFAKATYKGADLTAFLGNFYGFWLNLITFVLQLFLTGFVVTRFGVGGTLQIMPVLIAVASLGTVLYPSLLSTAAARLTEASTRYSFNRTGMELLYLPLPLELRNRTKAFVDVFVDRFSRGIGGMILVFFTTVVDLTPHRFAELVLVFAVIWILLTVAAQREYVKTVRKRLELRRLDFESARIRVADHATIELLERTAREGNPQQAAYALELLGQAPAYSVEPLITSLVSSPAPEVRAKCFELAREAGIATLSDAALRELRSARMPSGSPSVGEAVLYAMKFSSEPDALARRLFDHRNFDVQKAAMEALAELPETAKCVVDEAWLAAAAKDRDASRRALAAIAIRVCSDGRRQALERLVQDREPNVAAEAIRTAGALCDRDFVPLLVQRLSDPQVRGAAIESLASFGPRIIGTLADFLEDARTPIRVRRHIPRVLQRISDQRSVDVLARMLPVEDLTLRWSVLKSLNKLRDAAPNLNYGANGLVRQIHDEAKDYYQLHATLDALRETDSPGPATRLLTKTLRARLQVSLERVFRLLGLQYPPKQIYAAYLALNRRDGDDGAAALEFLDNILDRELKRILLPLLDEDAVLAERGRELFRIEPMHITDALRSLIHSGDAWLASCAIASAGELKVSELTADIRKLASVSGSEVAQVARSITPEMV